MADRILPGTALRIRRSRRTDLDVVRHLLGDAAASITPREFRRLLAGLDADVYLAEDVTGAAVGLVSVGYARLASVGGLAGWLDALVVRAEPADVVADGLVRFAEDRAKRRGCRTLIATPLAGDDRFRAALVDRGFVATDRYTKSLRE